MLRAEAGLDLLSAGLDDASLAGLDEFIALTNLRLSNNELTDAAVSVLSSLEYLEVLNLYGNTAISDASVDVFAELDNLRAVYLWETGITFDGMRGIRERHT